MTAIATPVPLPNSTCGAKMFAQGFGTWQGAPTEVKEAVINAIKSGYRLIDCARIYRNQEAVGEGIAQCIAEGIVKREDLFVVSKVWNTDHDPAYVSASTRLTLKELKLEYLDLLLIHWPVAFPNKTPVDDLANQTDFMAFDSTTGGCVNLDIPQVVTYKAMEQLVDEGLVRDIGVSNFTIEELETLLNGGIKYKPVCNQIEVQPALPQTEMKAFCDKNGIAIMAYCPLGLGMNPQEGTGLIYNEDLIALAKKHGFASAAALCLQWSSQKGFICLSKSVTPARIADNAKTPFGGISEEALADIEAFGKANPLRVCNPGVFRPVPGPFFA